MFKRLFTASSFAIALLLGSNAAAAAVLYSNFGPGDSFNAGVGYGINSTLSQGLGFVPTGTGFVTSIDVGMGVAGTPPQMVNFDLYADAGGNVGTLLESFSVVVSNAFGTLGTSTGVLSGATLLSSGQLYWLIASSPSGVNVPWNLNSVGELGLGWSNGTVYPNDILPTFRVNANLVPEPGTLLLLGTFGLAGLAALRRRKQ